jgi:hypothetical protein
MFSDRRLEVDVDKAELWKRFVLEHEGKTVCSDDITSAVCFASNILVCVASADADALAFSRFSKSCKSQGMLIKEAAD